MKSPCLLSVILLLVPAAHAQTVRPQQAKPVAPLPADMPIFKPGEDVDCALGVIPGDPLFDARMPVLAPRVQPPKPRTLPQNLRRLRSRI